jgi:hypothetical protein
MYGNAPVHSSQSTDVSEDILKCVCKLEGIDVAKAELNMRVDNELGKAQNLATQVERVSKSRFLALFCGKSFDGLQHRKHLD